MTIDLSTKLGQLFFVGFEGYTLTKKTKQFLETVQPGGIILFECNIKDKKQVKKLIVDINKCFTIKPFISVDQEGGSVERLRNICTSIPSVWGLSKIGLRELLEAQKIIIDELKELGFNMNFTPVLDINSNPQNPIIGTRAISGDPKIVSAYGLEIIKLYLKNKVVPVVKHFPGHGDLALDSHLALPILPKNKKELNRFELIPFIKAIKNNAPLIMTGHIQLPLLEKDKKKPASLSKVILNDVLKKKLGFKGLIITDELNMKGVTKNYTLPEASLAAISAGSDFILFNHFMKSALQAFNSVLQNAQRSKKLQQRIEESYRRIITSKKKYLTKTNSNHELNTAKHNLLSMELANKVVHWIKEDLFYKPVSSKDVAEIIFPVSIKLRVDDLTQICNELKLKSYHLHEYDINPKQETIDKLIHKCKKNSRKILITYDIAVRNNQKKLLNSLLNLYPDLVVISVGTEYDLEIAPKVRNFIAAYAPNYISLKAAFVRICA